MECKKTNKFLGESLATEHMPRSLRMVNTHFSYFLDEWVGVFHAQKNKCAWYAKEKNMVCLCIFWCVFIYVFLSSIYIWGGLSAHFSTYTNDGFVSKDYFLVAWLLHIDCNWKKNRFAITERKYFLVFLNRRKILLLFHINLTYLCSNVS